MLPKLDSAHMFLIIPTNKTDIFQKWVSLPLHFSDDYGRAVCAAPFLRYCGDFPSHGAPGFFPHIHMTRQTLIHPG